MTRFAIALLVTLGLAWLSLAVTGCAGAAAFSSVLQGANQPQPVYYQPAYVARRQSMWMVAQPYCWQEGPYQRCGVN